MACSSFVVQIKPGTQFVFEFILLHFALRFALSNVLQVPDALIGAGLMCTES